MLKTVILSGALSSALLFNATSACAGKVRVIGENPQPESASTASNCMVLRIEQGETAEDCKTRLKSQIPQPLIDTLLALASPLERDPKGQYLSHNDIFSWMQVFFPLKGHIVETADWGRDLFYRPNVSDADLQKEGLTREEYNHFCKEIQAQFDAETHKQASQLPQDSRGKPTQVATYRLLKQNATWGAKDNFWQKSATGYLAYKRLIAKVNSHSAVMTEFSFGAKKVMVLPSSLSRLTGLTRLDLFSNHINDISVLAALGNLQELDLAYNQIRDVSALKGLVNLRELHLFINQIKDVTPLAELINLQELYLDHNQITDISSLAGLMNLRTISINDNPHLWHQLYGESPEVAEARITANRAAVQALRARGCNVLVDYE